MTWSGEDDPAPYAQFAATLADRREVIRVPQAYLRRKRSEPLFAEPQELRSRFSVPFLIILGILTAVAGAIILTKLFVG